MSRQGRGDRGGGGGTVFYKMTGSGNDFIMVDGRHSATAEWPAERIARVCDRRMGAGADGLVLVTPMGGATVRMEYYNSDGSYAPMCGNAALCSARLAAYLEMAPPERIVLETGAGQMVTRCVGPGHMAELLLPPFPLPARVPIDPVAGEQGFFLGTVGVPHLVVFTEDAMAIDIPGRGRELRFHPVLGPDGANVNFISRIPGDPARWLIRTYERGIEAETLACGTGTVAAAFALAAEGRATLPSQWETCRGIQLSVAGSLEGQRSREAWLCGEGRLVFTGILQDCRPTLARDKTA